MSGQVPSCSSNPGTWKRKADEAMMDDGEWDSQCSPAPLKVPAVDLSTWAQMPTTEYNSYSFTQRGLNVFTGPAPSPSPASSDEMVTEDSGVFGLSSQDTMESMDSTQGSNGQVGISGNMAQGSQAFERIEIGMLQQPVSLNASREVVAMNEASNNLYSLQRSSYWQRSPDLVNDLGGSSQSQGSQDGSNAAYWSEDAREYQELQGYPKCECHFHAPYGNNGNNGNGNNGNGDNGNGNMV